MGVFKRSIDHLIHFKSLAHPIYYVGGFPAIDNLGDVALFQAMQKIFNQNDFIHYPGGRALKLTTRLFHLEAPALMAGGTLINRLSLPIAQDASLLFKNFFVFGTGVAQSSFWENVPGWENKMNEWIEVLNRASFVGVRGPLSKQHLNDHGLKNVEVVGDPVLSLANIDRREIGGDKKIIGLNIGVSKGHVWGSEEEILLKFVELAKSLVNDGWAIKWFVVCPEDLDITKEAAKESGTEDCIEKIYRDYEEFYEKTKDLTSFIGVKLHAVVLSLCQLIPSVMIEYRPKCRDFMLSLDLGDDSIRADKIEVRTLLEKVDEFHRTKEQKALRYSKSISKLLKIHNTYPQRILNNT